MANERSLVFVIDIGRPRNDCLQVDNLAKAIKSYPNMTFVICHLLACQLGDDEILKESLHKLNLPNVYFDLASITSNTKPDTYPYFTAVKYVRYACDILGSNKLMWGTDTPQALCKETYQNLIDYINTSSLFSEKEKENIFYNTANKVYFKINKE